MKPFAALLFVILTLIFASCSKTQPPTTVSPQSAIEREWYQLDRRDDYVTDFLLPAGGSKPIEIVSDEALFVGFKTDASPEVVKRYLSQKPQPVRLQVVGVSSFVGSVIGCGGEFPPVDGKLRFLAVNDTDVALRLVIFKRKATSNVIWPGVKKSDTKN